MTVIPVRTATSVPIFTTAYASYSAAVAILRTAPILKVKVIILRGMTPRLCHTGVRPHKSFRLCPKMADYAGSLTRTQDPLRVMPGPRPTKVRLCPTNPHGDTPVTRWRTAQGYQYARRPPKLEVSPVVSYLVFEFGAIFIIFLF